MKVFMVGADASGRIFEDKKLLMTMSRAGHCVMPQAGELVPLPRESELFLLPGRFAKGYDPNGKKIVETRHLAVGAFAAPGYTLSAHPCYAQDENAPMLPLFAYGAIGYGMGKFWIAATRVDSDKRQEFAAIKPGKIASGCRMLLQKYPRNRLVAHIINNCVRRYDCPAARNFALGRYEAPLPTSRACNASCLGCISQQPKDSPVKTTPQCRLTFTPSAREIVEVMTIHEQREKRCPVYSFGQGCEGDPLVNAPLLAESIAMFRALSASGMGHGTINCNTNASDSDAVLMLAQAGLTSMRVSMNSARDEFYAAYYRPKNYSLANVRESIRVAGKNGVFVSINLLYFPGFSDTAPEIEALADLCANCGVSMIQLRNLNIDPGWYLRQLPETENISVGLAKFMEIMKKRCPWLKFGYFNPWLGDRAEITAPAPK